MLTVTTSLLWSGNNRTRAPLASEYSEIPSISLTFIVLFGDASPGGSLWVVVDSVSAVCWEYATAGAMASDQATKSMPANGRGLRFTFRLRHFQIKNYRRAPVRHTGSDPLLYRNGIPEVVG